MKAHELLEKEKRWTKHVYARDATGDRVDIDHPKAYSFCLIGALRICYSGDERKEKITIVQNELVKTYNPDWENSSAEEVITGFNDDEYTTHQSVYELLKHLDI